MNKTKIKEYERDVINSLLADTEYKGIVLPGDSEELKIEFTGVGYFLSFQNEKYPEERVVLDKPNISGYVNGNHVGFVAFIVDSEFTLECYTYNEEFTPEDREGVFSIENA